MIIQEIIQHLENLAPSMYQENYDNAGLLTGNPKDQVLGILIALDTIESVIDEAIEKKCNLIIAHHPIIFKGLKNLNGKNYIEKTIIKAIKNDIAIYAIHTNLDNVRNGVNFKIAEKLELQNVRILAPKAQTLMKLTTFCPIENTETILKTLAEAGAGQIGEYKNCSFRSQGIGTFEPSEIANPHIGKANELEEVNENRLEVIFPIHLKNQILQALRQAHPYEEIAFFLHTLENQNQEIGAGAIGELAQPMSENDFLKYLKDKMQLDSIRYTQFLGKEIQKVALCGGTGSFLLQNAIKQKADVFISADFKYHEFFDADDKILIADIGHYESEIFTTELLKDYLTKEFSDLKILLTTVNTNPIQYF